MDVLVDRCAGLDVHKDQVRRVCVVGISAAENGRSRFGRSARSRHRCGSSGVAELERGDGGGDGSHRRYWKPVWYVLEDAEPFELLLVNPPHIKEVSGRKTDVNDATWIAQLLECGLLAGSFVPPREVRELRDVTRYRRRSRRNAAVRRSVAEGVRGRERSSWHRSVLTSPGCRPRLNLDGWCAR